MRTEQCQQKRTDDFGTLRAMPDPATKLRQLRLAAGFESAAAAARRFGWPLNTYKSHENGLRPISKKAAIKYANAYKVLPGWLLYDSGPKVAVQQSSREQIKIDLQGEHVYSVGEKNPETTLAYAKVPRLSWDVMANMTNIAQAIAEATDFYLAPADAKLTALSFALKMPDDSMLATAGSGDSFRRGDDLIFNPQAPVSPGDYVLAKIFARNETVFRQYRESGYDKQGRKIVTLHTLNENWADEDIILGAGGDILARLIRHSRDYS